MKMISKTVITNLEKIEVIVAANFAHDHSEVTKEVRSLVQESLRIIRDTQPRTGVDGVYCDCEVPTPSTTKFCHFCYRPVLPRR